MKSEIKEEGKSSKWREENAGRMRKRARNCEGRCHKNGKKVGGDKKCGNKLEQFLFLVRIPKLESCSGQSTGSTPPNLQYRMHRSLVQS